jgi:hypothetical protein
MWLTNGFFAAQLSPQNGDAALWAHPAIPGTRAQGYGFGAGRKMPTRTRPLGTPTRVPWGFGQPLSNTTYGTWVCVWTLGAASHDLFSFVVTFLNAFGNRYQFGGAPF